MAWWLGFTCMLCLCNSIQFAVLLFILLAQYFRLWQLFVLLQSFFGFGPSLDIELVLDGQDTRKTAEIKAEDGKIETHYLYYDGETIGGKVLFVCYGFDYVIWVFGWYLGTGYWKHCTNYSIQSGFDEVMSEVNCCVDVYNTLRLSTWLVSKRMSRVGYTTVIML